VQLRECDPVTQNMTSTTFLTIKSHGYINYLTKQNTFNYYSLSCRW